MSDQAEQDRKAREEGKPLHQPRAASQLASPTACYFSLLFNDKMPLGVALLKGSWLVSVHLLPSGLGLGPGEPAPSWGNRTGRRFMTTLGWVRSVWGETHFRGIKEA